MTILASVQASSAWLDREESAAKACDLIRQAGKAGASFIAFPENFIPGHPSWFHYLPAGHPEAMKRAMRLLDQATTIPGLVTERLSEAAREAKVVVVIGLTEVVDEAGGTLFNTQLCIDADGTLVGKHQKLVPTMTERLVHAPGGAETQRVFETSLGVVSSLICGENSNPLALARIANERPVIHVTSWPAHVSPSSLGGVRDISELTSRGVAHMLGCYVVSSCGVNDQVMIDDMAQNEADLAFMADPLANGGSCIVDPSGRIIAGPVDGNVEDILYAEVDLLNACRRSRLINDVAGHYNRSDVYQLTVDDRPRPLVQSARNTQDFEHHTNEEDGASHA